MITQGNSTHRIENWMTAQIYGPNRMPGGVVFTLRHAGLDEGSRLLRTWQVDTIPERDEFRDLVVEIDSAAQDDCEQLGWSTQRYLLMATSKQGKELGSLTLRYATSSLAEPGITADSEPASPRGQVAQAMRFAEASQRTLQAGMGFIVETLSRRLTAQDQLITEQMRNQQKYAEQINAMADRSLERETMADARKREQELEFHRTIAEIDHKHALFQFGIERVAPLIPLIGNRLFGKAPAETAAAAHDQLLASILGSLTPEQVAALKKVLTPEQMVGINELYEAIMRNGKPAHSEKLSEQSALMALDYIKTKLLPWAVQRLEAGEPMDPRSALPAAARVLELLLRSLSREQYDMLVSTDQPFTAEERKAFGKMAEAMNLVPTENKPDEAASERAGETASKKVQ